MALASMLLVLALLVMPCYRSEFDWKVCDFVSVDMFEHCCCGRSNQTDCWEYPPTFDSRVTRSLCCDGQLHHCPLGSPALPSNITYVGSESGQATYNVDGHATSIVDILNCVHDTAWEAFRQRLARHSKESIVECGTQDPVLEKMAVDLFAQFSPSIDSTLTAELRMQYFHKDMLETLEGHLKLVHPDGFCFFGYIAAAFLVVKKAERVGAFSAARTVLAEAYYAFEGKNKVFDVASSTSWPIGPWDLLANIRKGSLPEISSVDALLSQNRALLIPRVASVIYPGPQGDALLARAGGSKLKQRINVAVFVEHPALDLEIIGFLLRVFPDLLVAKFLCAPASFSYKDNTSTCEALCDQFVSFCQPPHAFMEVEGLGAPEALVSSHLLLCSLYQHCAWMEKVRGSPLPLISYYGGCPWNSWAIRSGHQTVLASLEPMREFLKRDTLSTSPALLFADAPYTAEIVHAYSGVRLPVYRPLSLYQRATYTPMRNDTILLPKSSSSTLIMKTQVLSKFLQLFAGSNFLPRFEVQLRYLHFDEFANYLAILYWPAPHSWVLMQFREFYNMNIPLLIPDKKEIITFGSDWFEKLHNNLNTTPVENWKPLESFWQSSHPFSPWILDYALSADYILAGSYWTQWLEFFQWPEIQTYSGIPHLLVLARSLDFWSISEGMGKFNRAATRRALEFWSGALPGMLPAKFSEL